MTFLRELIQVRKGFCHNEKSTYNPPRIFPLKESEQGAAIRCIPGLGPNFVDIVILDVCNTTNQSSTFDFGSSYVNDNVI
jgi:hypothetical protein